jgi:hypothetical protein
MMYVYISPSVEVAAQRYGVEAQVERLRQRIEEDPSLFSLFFDSRFPCWIRRMKCKRLRLTAVVKTFFGDDQVLYLAELLTRGGGEYKRFLEHREQYEEQKVDWTPISEWLQERKHTTPPSQLPMPGYLADWLKRPDLIKRQNTVIYESQIWVSAFMDQASPVAQNTESFHELVYALVSGATSKYKTENTVYKNVHRCIDSVSGCCALFSKMQPHDEPERTIIFLLAAFAHIPKAEEIARVGNDLGLFGSKVSHNYLSAIITITANDIARYSRRSYPDFIVYDFEIWKAMESDEKVNLAMSGEEEELLHSMTFPAFINGRAGSGKSTMLHYAFAYYCDRYLTTQQKSRLSSEELNHIRPLFLTYSDRLTEKARYTVCQILKSHARFGGQTLEVATNHDLLHEFFQTFQSFLLNCLPHDELEHFDRKHYISFHEFKKRYATAFHQPKYSPEICWHAIRTYIKGHHFVDEDQEYLSTDEYYEEIPKKQKKISDEDFQKIYDSVWAWYQDLCTKEHLWDDQDLTRAVLTNIANGKVPPNSYAAIFCDEAQDFTRIEFQLILRLSVWSQYSLPYSVESLPFAFAGDPLQTLNPTGFSWTSFRANFYENILIPLDPENLRNLRDPERLALEELHQNYRSPAPIVKFTNVVHLWRYILFDNRKLEPQEPWRTTGCCPTQKGIINLDLLTQEFKTRVHQGAILLLPCDEGGEVDFIKRSPILKEVFPMTNGEKPPLVYTPVGLKGLEEPDIMVGFFGQYYVDQFDKTPLAKLPQETDDLKLEYFLNKLYVAVSRSTQYLTIIDTETGDKVFWQAASTKALPSWLQSLKQQQKLDKDSLSHWESNLEPLHVPVNLQKKFQVDFYAKAKTWLQSGLDNSDIEHLRTAIYFYERVDKTAEIRYCEAWILRFEGKLQSAGKMLMELEGLAEVELDPRIEAWNCFWDGKHWKDLETWFSQTPDTEQTWLRPVVQFMLQTSSKKISAIPTKLIGDFSAFLSQVEHSFWEQQRHDSTWKAIIDRYQQAVTAAIGNAKLLKSSYWQSWSDALQNLAAAGIHSQELNYLAGHCLYQAREFEPAVNLWDEQDRTEHLEYAIAKAETTPAPENIPWFNQAKLFDRTLKVWAEHQSPIAETWEAVLPDVREALNHQRQHTELLDLEIRTKQWVEAIQLCDQHRCKMATRIAIIHGMAADKDLTVESIMQSGQRALLGEFMGQTLNLPTWRPTNARVQEACIALEKIGEFRSALPMFERFFEDRNLTNSIQRFVRERWLVMKGKQADFQEHTGRKEEAEQTRGDRRRQAQDWGIDLQTLSVDVPTLPDDMPLPDDPPASSAHRQTGHSSVATVQDPQVSQPSSEPDHVPEQAGETGAPGESEETAQLRQDIANLLTQFSHSDLEQIKHYQHYLLYLQQMNRCE